MARTKTIRIAVGIDETGEIRAQYTDPERSAFHGDIAQAEAFDRHGVTFHLRGQVKRIVVVTATIDVPDPVGFSGEVAGFVEDRPTSSHAAQTLEPASQQAPVIDDIPF